MVSKNRRATLIYFSTVDLHDGTKLLSFTRTSLMSRISGHRHIKYLYNLALVGKILDITSHEKLIYMLPPAPVLYQASESKANTTEEGEVHEPTPD